MFIHLKSKSLGFKFIWWRSYVYILFYQVNGKYKIFITNIIEKKKKLRLQYYKIFIK